MSTETITDVVKFHLSLNVTDLARSLDFYRVLFGMEPAKVRADYAKFELTEPPLVMSLIPIPPGAGGTLNHVGLRVLDSTTLVALQARLELAGHATQREDGVECCYSKQTKFWVADPDRTLWELYVLHGDADEHAAGPGAEHGAAGDSTLRTEGWKLPLLNAAPAPQPRVIRNHLLTQPLPERFDSADAAVDEVQLQGTLNLAVDRDALRRLFAEARRVLRPGGKLFAHVLTSDRRTIDRPNLPGPAALVERVLPVEEVVKLFEESGFVGLQLTKYGEQPCFHVDDAELRETKLEAFAPTATCCSDEVARVVYRGPLRSLTDDAGRVYPRGVPVEIAAAQWDALKRAGCAASFTRFGGESSADACCG